MNTEASPTPSQQPRRAWRQWSKLARVRIGFVLLLVVAISVFALWWPRRGVVAVLFMGGDVYDAHAVDRIKSLQSRVAIDVWAVIGPWIEPHASWLATDGQVCHVYLYNTPSAEGLFKHLRRFPRLSSVALHAGQVGPALDELAEIKTLKTVDVLGVQASDHLGELNRLPHIAELSVYGGCPKTGGGWKGLRDMPHLRSLRIEYPASFEALEEVGQIPSLNWLILMNGVQKDDDLRLLSGSRTLRFFDVSRGSGVKGRVAGGIGAEGLKHLARIHSLEMLTLHLCSATDDEFQVLAELHNLKRFSIGKTNVTPDGIDRLKRALPKCEID